MEITVRSATKSDLESCTAVEKAAMNDFCYLKDVWDYFFATDGALNCAFIDGKMVGIGKFTVLYDGSGWLETLRVDPKYQGIGVGKQIYKAYESEAKKYNCPSMGMYTGVSNVISAGLAGKYGLTQAGLFRGYNLTEFEPKSYEHSFKHVLADRAEELIIPLKEEYHDYVAMNRTFYRINELTARGLAAEGKVFEDEQSKSFIVCGSRFQHHVSLHIAMMHGDYAKCLDFAKAYAKIQRINKITCTIPLENPKLENFLKDNGFVREPSDIITKEVVF